MYKEIMDFLADFKNAYIVLFKTNPIQANISLSLIVLSLFSFIYFHQEFNKKQIQIIYYDRCPQLQRGN
jgi:hypothetical protein